MRHPNHDIETQTRILLEGTREQVLAWLKWNDPNGCYADEDCRCENDLSPWEDADARDLMAVKCASIQVTAAWMAQIMKTEILADVANGVVPETVERFEQLHDYEDANMYGRSEWFLGEFESRYAPGDEGRAIALSELCEVKNAAFEIVNTWIASGALVA